MIEQLEETISKFYPKNLLAFDPLYEQSEEYKLLTTIITRTMNDKPLSNRLVESIKKELPPSLYTIEDTTLFSFLDRCFTFQIEDVTKSEGNKKVYLILCISILASYYCIYRKKSEQVYDKDGSFIGFIDDADFNIDQSFNSKLINSLESLMLRLSYTKLEEKILLHAFPNYSIFGVSNENFLTFTALFKDKL